MENRQPFDLKTLEEKGDRWLAYVDGRLQGKALPFDSYHYDYYRKNLNVPGRAQHRDQMIWNHNAMETARGDKAGLYLPCSITGGVYASHLTIEVDHRLPYKIGTKTIHLRTNKDLGYSHAGSERVKRDVIDPNERAAQGRYLQARKNFPEAFMVPPFDFEGAARTARSSARSAFGRKMEEEDFMGGWYGEVDRLNGLVYEGDIPFSRNGNWEEMRGNLAALGYLNGITRDDGNFQFYRLDGSYSPFAERAQYSLDYLVYALENSFYAREVATSLAWKLEIDKRLRDPEYNAKQYKPIDVNLISDQLREEYFGDSEWAKECRKHMDALRGPAEDILKKWFIAHIDEERFIKPLSPEMQQHWHDVQSGKVILNANGLTGSFNGQKYPQSLEDLKMDKNNPVIAGSLKRIKNPDLYLLNGSQTKDLRIIDTPIPPQNNAGHGGYNTIPFPRQIADKRDVFTKNTSFLFDDDFLGKISSEREKMAVQLFVGAAMTSISPFEHPSWTFILHDVERNTHAKKVADAEGFKDLKETAQFLNDKDRFETEIVQPASDDVMAVKTKYLDELAENGQALPPVITQLDMMAAHGLFGKLDHLTAVDGQKGSTSEGRMALRMKMLDLFASELILPDNNWAVSEDQVQHVMRATLIQCGVINRGWMDNYNMVLKDADLKPLSLYDRIVPIYDWLKKSVKDGVQVKEHAKALARLIQIHEMYIDPEFNRDQKTPIKFESVHESLTSYYLTQDRFKMDKLYPEIRNFLLDNCADWLDAKDLNDLDQDFKDKWRENKNKIQTLTKKKPPRQRILQRRPSGL